MAGFQKAQKGQGKLRLALDGVAGSGKTMTALAIATALAKHMNGRIALIDTENFSSTHYADKFNYDVAALIDYDPRVYVEAIHMAEDAGYDVLIIDSLSHAWAGEGGALTLKDNAARKSSNDYTAWRDVSPLVNKLVDALVGCKIHLIVTMRSKMEYSMEKDPSTGKTTVRKVGMAPVMRAGVEYEFDVLGDLDIDHNLTISKTRCDALDGKVINRAGKDVAETLWTWLTTGEPAKPAPFTAAAKPETPKPDDKPTPIAPPSANDIEVDEQQKQMRKDLEMEWTALFKMCKDNNITVPKVKAGITDQALADAVIEMEALLEGKGIAIPKKAAA